MKNLVVRNYMTASPLTIGHDQPVALAYKLMREHHIRHLPVLDGGQLVGIISLSDLRLTQIEGLNANMVTVEEAMTEEPFTASPDDSLEQTVRTMIEKKYSSAIILEKNVVSGVFTTIDGMKALVELLDKKT